MTDRSFFSDAASHLIREFDDAGRPLTLPAAQQELAHTGHRFTAAEQAGILARVLVEVQNRRRSREMGNAQSL